MCQSNLYQAAQLTNRQGIRVSRSKVTFIKSLNRKVKKNNDMVKKLFFHLPCDLLFTTPPYDR